jgi:phospholipase/carboxylesterase
VTAAMSKVAAGVLTARPGTVNGGAGTAGLHVLRLDDSDRVAGLYVPERYDPETPAPLIVLLHGAGGQAAHMLDRFKEAADARGIVLLAPESRGRSWDVILGGFGPDVAYLDAALAEMFGAYAIDSGRIAIGGFSDGASYALSLGLTNGELFRDILAFSPGFMAAGARSGTPHVFISHGVSDEVLPIDPCSRRLAPALRAAGYPLTYREFDGGHVVPPEMVTAAVARFLA